MKYRRYLISCLELGSNQEREEALLGTPRTVRRICSSGAIAYSGSRKSESRASVAAMTLRNRIGDPGLRAVKKERARLGIPDEAWVRHHPPIFGTNLL